MASAAHRSSSTAQRRTRPVRREGSCIDDAGGNKIAVIKVVREKLGLSLKDAMELVQRAPVMLADLPEGKERAAFVDALVKAGARAR